MSITEQTLWRRDESHLYYRRNDISPNCSAFNLSCRVGERYMMTYSCGRNDILIAKKVLRQSNKMRRGAVKDSLSPWMHVQELLQLVLNYAGTSAVDACERLRGRGFVGIDRFAELSDQGPPSPSDSDCEADAQ